MSVSGRFAVVAGAEDGLGLAIARRLAEEGAHVLLGRSTPRAESRATSDLAKELLEVHPDVMGPDAASAESLMQAAMQRFGRVDVAVSAWDQVHDQLLAETDVATAEAVLGVNLLGALYLVRAAARVMRGQGSGRIIALTSRNWLGGETGAVYGAARAGVVGLTRALAWELVQDGVTVNCVASGVIETEGLKSLPASKVEDLLRLQPIRRPGTPAEVAEAVLFFAADEAGYITGQTLYVCGGKSALSSLSA